MAEVGRWKPYTQRQGQLLPAFFEDALDPGDTVFFINDAVDSLALTPLLRGEWNLVWPPSTCGGRSHSQSQIGRLTRAKTRLAGRESGTGRQGKPRDRQTLTYTAAGMLSRNT